MVSTRTLLSTLGALALAASANSQGVLDNLLNLDLDLGLLQDGALVTADVFADVITEDTCPGSAISVGVVANVLNLVRVCACVSVIQIGPTESVCGDCPANASPICARGRCACQCDEGFVSDSTTGTCVDENACGNSGGSLVSNNDGSFVCFCPSPLLINGQGTCSLPASARARAARRNLVLGGASLPYTSNGYSGKYCPAFETACPLPSGGYECIDTRDSLTSFGGCEGAGGQNCLAIEGALGVRCAATPRGNSECQVSSCFAGYRFENGRCI